MNLRLRVYELQVGDWVFIPEVAPGERVAWFRVRSLWPCRTPGPRRCRPTRRGEHEGCLYIRFDDTTGVLCTDGDAIVRAARSNG